MFDHWTPAVCVEDMGKNQMENEGENPPLPPPLGLGMRVNGEHPSEEGDRSRDPCAGKGSLCRPQLPGPPSLVCLFLIFLSMVRLL